MLRGGAPSDRVSTLGSVAVAVVVAWPQRGGWPGASPAQPATVLTTRRHARDRTAASTGGALENFPGYRSDGVFRNPRASTMQSPALSDARFDHSPKPTPERQSRVASQCATSTLSTLITTAPERPCSALPGLGADAAVQRTTTVLPTI